ncbi:MAG: Fe-S cluster assembly protein SufD [Opitutaceae bacterium]
MSPAPATAAPITPEPALVQPSAFDHVSAKLGHLPAWWTDLKRRAWAHYLELPLPKRTDELWRFSSIQGLRLEESFPLAAPAASEIVASAVARSNLVKQRTAQAIYVNDVRVAQDALPDHLVKAGVIFDSIEHAVLRHPALIQAHFMAQDSALGSEKLTALHRALTTGGAFIYVPKGVEVNLPLVLYHWAAGGRAAVFPHTLVVAEDNAKVTVVEFRQSASDTDTTFSAGVNDLYAGPGAQVTYVSAQRWSRSSLGFQGNETVVQRDGRVLSLGLQLGGRQTRTESHSRLQGAGAFSQMLSLAVAHGDQEFDQRTLQSHQSPHTGSDLLYKNALFDKARTIFSGLIVVDPGAQKTDAYQSNRNLLCSPEAEANSLPGLEIEANDVRCTHGATNGKIDDEELFYLAARGISKPVAEQLLVFGFFEEVLGKLESEQLQSVLRELIQAKFQK